MAGLGFNIAPGTSAEDLAARRQLAYQLMQQGSSGEAIKSPWQGANRIAQALVGGYDAYDIDQKQKAEKKEASELLAEALGTGPQTSSAAPQFGPAAAPAGPRPSPLATPAQGSFGAAGRDYAPVPPQPAQAAAAAAGRDYAPPAPVGPDRSSLPAGMRNNNPGNIKFQPGLPFAGLTGPSQNLDQGDPQAVFDTPENGMAAMAQLAARKYQGGMRTANDIIAGRMGWTPGNSAAAANVAATMGLRPDEDLGLSDPARMQTFMKALTTQEHGAASKLYTDDMYSAAVGASGAPRPPAPAPVTQPDRAAVARAAPPAAAGPLGIDPATAKIISRLSMNPYTAPMANKLLEAAIAHKGQSRYTASKQGILDTWTGQITPGSAEGQSAEYGTTPHYWEDEEGNVHVAQLSKAGGQQEAKLPKGGRWLPGITTQDTGTELANVDRRTGAVRSTIKKDIVGKESAEEEGKARGTARVALPQVTTATNRLLKTIDQLDKDPMRSSFTGYSGYLPNMSPEANDYQGLLNQVQGGTFLQVFNDLRGGGAITDIEGRKGTEALTRLQQVAPSDKGYQAALDDARQVFKEILGNVRKRAGVTEEEAADNGGDKINAMKSKYGLE